jgi:hypothetical protein
MTVAGCATPLEAPSAYSDERYLCEPQDSAEFDAQMVACRDTRLRGGSCAGFVSMRGEIGEQPFVVESPLFESFYIYDETKPNALQTLAVSAQAPYFNFRLTSERVTRVTTDAGTICQTLGANLFTLEVRGSSHNQALIAKQCDFNRRADGLFYSFSARIALGGNLEACTYLLAPDPTP